MESPDAGRFARRSAAGFVAVLLGAFVLALAARTATGPVVQVDRAVAGDLNAVVAPRPWLVTLLQVVTAAGSPVTAWVVLSTLALALLVRRRTHLALYVAVTGLGTATLSPLLKQLVDRLRPVVDMPVASAGGPSFPSGHALGVTVWVGVVLLVLLPVLPPRWRRGAAAAGVVLVVAVGLTRLALGVHFVSDVLAGWLVGAGWLLVTASAFRAWRCPRGPVVPRPLDGLAPEDVRDLVPPHAPEHVPPHPWTTVARLLVVAVLLLGAVIGAGLLLRSFGSGSALERLDTGVLTWLVEHRTPALDAVSEPLDELGNTWVVVGGGAVAALLAYLATRRLRPGVVIATALVGEALIFLTASAVVGRPRPPVPHLDTELPPTSSFPSGHTAAAVCLYGAVAALVLLATRSWWRWPVLGVAVAAVVVVAAARLYRGAHYPTDVLASVAFAVPWLLATLRLVGHEPRADPVARRSDPVGGAR